MGSNRSRPHRRAWALQGGRGAPTDTVRFTRGDPPRPALPIDMGGGKEPPQALPQAGHRRSTRAMVGRGRGVQGRGLARCRHGMGTARHGVGTAWGWARHGGGYGIIWTWGWRGWAALGCAGDPADGAPGSTWHSSHLKPPFFSFLCSYPYCFLFFWLKKKMYYYFISLFFSFSFPFCSFSCSVFSSLHFRPPLILFPLFSLFSFLSHFFPPFLIFFSFLSIPFFSFLFPLLHFLFPLFFFPLFCLSFLSSFSFPFLSYLLSFLYLLFVFFPLFFLFPSLSFPFFFFYIFFPPFFPSLYFFLSFFSSFFPQLSFLFNFFFFLSPPFLLFNTFTFLSSFSFTLCSLAISHPLFSLLSLSPSPTAPCHPHSRFCVLQWGSAQQCGQHMAGSVCSPNCAIPFAWEGANFHPLAPGGLQLPFFLTGPLPEPGPDGICAHQTPSLRHSHANPIPLAWRELGELRMVMWIHWNVRGTRPALGFVHLPRTLPPSSRVPASLQPTVAALSPAWAAPSHPEPSRAPWHQNNPGIGGGRDALLAGAAAGG